METFKRTSYIIEANPTIYAPTYKNDNNYGTDNQTYRNRYATDIDTYKSYDTDNDKSPHTYSTDNDKNHHSYDTDNEEYGSRDSYDTDNESYKTRNRYDTMIDNRNYANRIGYSIDEEARKNKTHNSYDTDDEIGSSCISPYLSKHEYDSLVPESNGSSDKYNKYPVHNLNKSIQYDLNPDNSSKLSINSHNKPEYKTLISNSSTNDEPSTMSSSCISDQTQDTSVMSSSCISNRTQEMTLSSYSSNTHEGDETPSHGFNLSSSGDSDEIPFADDSESDVEC